MPELKHNFLKGRMNKDLDERLVPNGEYRDALNIEISTSEDSNTGAVQNVKGNAKVTVLDQDGNNFMNTSISTNAITVGTCVDDSQGKIYNLIHLASDLEANGTYASGTRFTGVKSDVITEFTKDVNAETGVTFPLVVDAFESRHAPKGVQAAAGIINGSDLDQDELNTSGFFAPLGVRPGMRVQLISPNGIDAYSETNQVFVTKINYNIDPTLVTVETTLPNTNVVTGAPIVMSQLLIDNGYVYKFTAPRILNFNPGTTEQETNTTGTPTSYTPNKNIITGINVYNDILFFTDNRNEPKRVVLKDFRQDTFVGTFFNQKIQFHSIIAQGVFLEEELVTVAKRAPKLAPKVEVFANERTGSTNSVIGLFDPNDPTNQGVFTLSVALANSNNTEFVPLDSNWLEATNNNTFDILATGSPSWEVGDFVDISGGISSASGTILINSVDPNNPNLFNITIIDVEQGYLDIVVDNDTQSSTYGQSQGYATTNADPEIWFAQLAFNKSLYEKSFCFFSYRYKYLNDEVSPLAPYSRAIFTPGFYEYFGRRGYNKGMENHIDKIIIYDFVEQEAKNTKDIKEVQIVFKSSSTENPVIINTVRKSDPEFIDKKNSFISGNSGVIEIKSEAFGNSIQTKQQLRVNDNIPRKALSQEVTASRLMFGNYVEGFDLKPTLKVNTSIISSPPSEEVVVLPSVNPYYFQGTWGYNIDDQDYVKNGFGTFKKDAHGYHTSSNAYTATYKKGNWWAAEVLYGNNGFGPKSFGHSASNLRYPDDWPGGVSSQYGGVGGIGTYNLPGVTAGPNFGRSHSDGHNSNPATTIFAQYPNPGSFGGTQPNAIGLAQRLPIGSIAQGQTYWSQYVPVLGGPDNTDIGSHPGKNAYIVPADGYYDAAVQTPKVSIKAYFTNGKGESAVARVVREAKVPFIQMALVYEAPSGPGAIGGGTITFLDEMDNNQYNSSNQFSYSFDFFEGNGMYGGTTMQAGGLIYVALNTFRFDFDESSGLSEARACVVTARFDVNLNTGINDSGYGMQINGPDSTSTATIPASTPNKSVKSDSEYQVGVVYGDFYGRETPVITDDTNRLKIPKANSTNKNLIVSEIADDAPDFADYYKFYIKEIVPEYYNLVMHSAYPADLDEFETSITAAGAQSGFLQGTSEAWLAFNSADRSKIEIDDYLVQKKQHGTVIAVADPLARWRVLDIVDNAVGDMTSSSGTNLSSSTSFEINGVNLLGATFEDINGKFFVKIKADAKFDEHISGVGSNTNAQPLVPGNDAQSKNGAVFEIRKKDIRDVDLFFEASQAFPIKLSDKNVYHFASIDDTLKIFPQYNQSYQATTGVTQTTCNNFNDALFVVQELIGAKSFGSDQINTSNTSNPTFGEGLVEIKIRSAVTGFGISSIVDPVTQNQLLSTGDIPDGSIISIVNKNGGFVSGEVVGFAAAGFDSSIFIKPFSCLTSSSDKVLPIGLDWWNVIAFGNGVESDRIRDDFNADTVYKYTAVGKQSGFEASIKNENYKEVRYENNIIFSQIFSRALGGGYNEFIAAEDIVKEINSEYGSLQKLFARDGDLVTFCENKVLRILSSGKDALFNAEGKAEIISSTNVLGQAVPYLGDYGISQNPESFAAEEYRLYFADKNRGAICRLSRDGITPISDAGMRDFFNDHLANAQSIVGSYDGKKNEYNITIHEITHPNSKKNVYTLGYKENVKGWTSFKSFIKEQGVSLQNNYYTFKNSLCYLHHPDSLTHTYCNFYSTSNNASITDIFSESSDVVKLYKTISYEGTQSKVVKFTDEVVDGVTYNDNEYYNAVAKSGWFVESITTDMQEGDIDEFIEKEGKWHNYIKGVDTTFTNATDNNGTATGNIDFNEFSIQGIGNLSSNATIQSGTLPGTGFNYNATISPCSSVLNLFTATQANNSNITSFLPAGGFATNGVQEITITPNANHTIAASQFTAEIPNITLPSEVLSISFADTIAAHDYNNEVVATLLFNTSFTISADINIDIPICVTPVLLPIDYQAVIIINGDFTSGSTNTPMTISHTFGNGLVSPTLTPIGSAFNQKTFNFTATIPQNFNGSLIDISISNGSNQFLADPNVSFTDPTSAPPNTISPETGNYTFTTAHQPNINSSVQIDYVPTVTNTAVLDNSNTIEITTSFQGLFLSFANYDPASGNFSSLPNNVNINTQGNTYQYGVSTNGGPFTAVVTSDPNNIISNIVFSHSFTDPSQNFVQITTNTSGSASDIIATITVTSDANSGLTDTITITQPPGAQIDAVANWVSYYNNGFSYVAMAFGDPNIPTNTYVDNLTTTAYQLPGAGVGVPGAGPSAPLSVEINVTHNNLPPENSLSMGLIDLIDTGDGTSWIQLSSGIGIPTDPNTQLPLGAVFTFTADANNTGSVRSLTISIPHPDDTSLTDTVIVQQESGYSASTNTLEFKEPTATSDIDGVYVEPGTASGNTNEIEFDHTAQQAIVRFKIPFADSDSQVSIGFYGTTANGLINNTNEDFQFDQWNENDGVAPTFIPYEDVTATINTGGWFSTTPTTEYHQPIYTQGITAPGTIFPVSTDVNYKITMNLTENTAALGNGLGTWEAQFPVARYLTIKGFNPHNSTNLENDDVIIKQKAMPAVRFINGNNNAGFGMAATFIQLGGYGWDAGMGFLSGIPQLVANGSTPNLLLHYFDNSGDANNLNFGNSISASWVTMQSSPLIAFGSTGYEYNLNIQEIQSNFGLNNRYCAISAYHSDIAAPDPTVNTQFHGNSDEDIIVLEQPFIVPIIAFDPTNLPGNVIHNTAIGDNGVQYTQTQQVTATLSATTFSGTGPFTFTLPINHNVQNPNQPIVTFLEATDDYQITNFTASHPSFFTTTDLAACSISNGLMTFQVSELPSNSVFAFRLKVTHFNNPQFFAEITIIYS